MTAHHLLIRCLAAFMWGLIGAMPAIAQSDGARLSASSVVLLRHALAPGVGDPERLDLNDCSTQRNLSEQGRAQAKRIGEFFQRQSLPVKLVWSSQWCRTRETADLAFPGKRVDQAAFNSFFGEPDSAPAQTREARDLLDAWRGDGLLVVITHQVNITALTGVVPASGEGVVLSRQDGEWTIAGRVSP